MASHLNLISFDIPYPADYGGVIDIFYKIKYLQAEGVKIHLHCFEYGRAETDELKKYCSTVNYYPRKTTKSFLFNTLPYIVLSRQSDELKKNLLRNDYPILMDGLHSTYLLNDVDFLKQRNSLFEGGKGDVIIVRTHNIEHEYYENLAKVERNIFKRYYFYNEAGKLKKYEPILNHASAIASISPADTKYFSSLYKHVHYIPAFHPFEKVESKEGTGDYAFYHGNLSIGENNEAALYLIQKVFNDLPYKIIIAGNKPSDELKKAAATQKNVMLLDNLSPDQIKQHIINAQCNVLPTFQATGIKLKLLSALFAGRHCIVNSAMVEQTGLENLCTIADDPELMKDKISKLMKTPFNAADIEKREEILLEKFSNTKSAKALIKLF